MCCKPSTPPALSSVQRDIGFQVQALSLTSVSKVIGSRQELDSDRYVCTGASKEA